MSGLSRSSAARFSFLMAIPIILGSTIVEVFDVVSEGVGNIMWGSVLVCVVVSAASSFVAIELLMKLIRKRKLYMFAAYTAVLGILVLLDQYVFNLVL
jgi:undecaprenyl-diphosphatase